MTSKRSFPLCFPSRLSSRRRRIYHFLVGYFLLISLAMLWPLYPFFDSIRPYVFSIPFSLFYLVFLLGCTFVALVAVFMWESKNNQLD